MEFESQHSSLPIIPVDAEKCKISETVGKSFIVHGTADLARKLLEYAGEIDYACIYIKLIFNEEGEYWAMFSYDSDFPNPTERSIFDF